MHKKKHIWCSVMIILIVAFYQLTKYLAKSALYGGKIVNFIPKLVQFRYAENTGMAFSMFSGARWIFIVLTVAVCALALWYLFSNKCKSLWLYWSIGVVVAGGIGNLIDRALYGYVVDFIEPVFVNFAVFNIADCAVTCGAVVLVAYLFIDVFKKEDKNEPKS
jgi:signal peptidase II